jgi:hypothetical protein
LFEAAAISLLVFNGGRVLAGLGVVEAVIRKEICREILSSVPFTSPPQ